MIDATEFRRRVEAVEATRKKCEFTVDFAQKEQTHESD